MKSKGPLDELGRPIPKKQIVPLDEQGKPRLSSNTGVDMFQSRASARKIETENMGKSNRRSTRKIEGLQDTQTGHPKPGGRRRSLTAGGDLNVSTVKMTEGTEINRQMGIIQHIEKKRKSVYNPEIGAKRPSMYIPEAPPQMPQKKSLKRNSQTVPGLFQDAVTIGYDPSRKEGKWDGTKSHGPIDANVRNGFMDKAENAPESTLTCQVIPFNYENNEFTLNNYDRILFNNVPKGDIVKLLEGIKMIDILLSPKHNMYNKSSWKACAGSCAVLICAGLFVMALTISIAFQYILSAFMTIVLQVWCVVSAYSRGKQVVGIKERQFKIESLIEAANKHNFAAQGCAFVCGDQAAWIEFIIVEPCLELKLQIDGHKPSERLSMRNMVNKIGANTELAKLMREQGSIPPVTFF